MIGVGERLSDKRWKRILGNNPFALVWSELLQVPIFDLRKGPKNSGLPTLQMDRCLESTRQPLPSRPRSDFRRPHVTCCPSLASPGYSSSWWRLLHTPRGLFIGGGFPLLRLLLPCSFGRELPLLGPPFRGYLPGKATCAQRAPRTGPSVLLKCFCSSLCLYRWSR